MLLPFLTNTHYPISKIALKCLTEKKYLRHRFGSCLSNPSLFWCSQICSDYPLFEFLFTLYGLQNAGHTCLLYKHEVLKGLEFYIPFLGQWHPHCIHKWGRTRMPSLAGSWSPLAAWITVKSDNMHFRKVCSFFPCVSYNTFRGAPSENPSNIWIPRTWSNCRFEMFFFSNDKFLPLLYSKCCPNWNLLAWVA